MSTETQIVRELAPCLNRHFLGYLIQKNLEPSKLQKYIQDEIIPNPKNAVTTIFDRMKEKGAKRSGGDIQSLLGLEGVSGKMMESLVKEVACRFMLCIHLLENTSKQSEGWEKRDRLLREIIHEEVQHNLEEKSNNRRATDAIMLSQEFAKLSSKLDEIAESIDGLYEEEEEDDEAESEASSEEEDEAESEEEETDESYRGRSGHSKQESKRESKQPSKHGSKDSKGSKGSRMKSPPPPVGGWLEEDDRSTRQSRKQSSKSSSKRH